MYYIALKMLIGDTEKYVGIVIGITFAALIMTSNLPTGVSKTWSLGAATRLPILDFGRISSDINIADAQQKEAFLNYQKTVLNALVAYEQEKNRLVSVTQSVESDKTAAQLINVRYHKGLISFLNVLDAQRSLYAAQIAQAQSRAAFSNDLIVLYKALGG